MLRAPDVAADVSDRIDREAEGLASLEEKFAHALQEQRNAADRRAARDAADLDSLSTERLAAARERRDRAWREVREPFRSGAVLPEGRQDRRPHGGRGDPATATWLMARSPAPRKRVGSWGSTPNSMSAPARSLRSSRTSSTLLASGGALRDAGVPDVLDRQAWARHPEILADLSTSVAGFGATVSQLEQQRQEVVTFEQDVAAVSATLGIEATDTPARWSRLDSILQESRENRTAVDNLRHELETAQQDRDRAAEALAGHEAVLDRLSADDDLAETVQRSRRVADHRSRETALLGQVRAAANAGTDVAELVKRVAGGPSRRTRTRLSERETEQRAAEERDGATTALAERRGGPGSGREAGERCGLHEKRVGGRAAFLQAGGVPADPVHRPVIEKIGRDLGRTRPAPGPRRRPSRASHARACPGPTDR